MAETKNTTIIKPISRTDVHKICSGQVILDLCSAVKELVENSLDAGATSIEVKLKEYGGESFEVIDNGCGISPENYQSVTLKYHTSKISDFTDLQSLTSFGFRGEALSSLCALGDVTIATRTKHEPVGVQLKYDHSGLISSQKALARQIGTSVSVAKLFTLLPVRHKEFLRNIKREYAHLIALLQAYALISKGVKFLCTNAVGRSEKSVLIRTQGTSIKDNIVMLFGSKTLTCLDSIDSALAGSYRVEGFLSKPGSGSGRASGDRQFFYINRRPVDMSKIGKLLNELYRSYNSLQYPMAILNFILPTSSYDVNVTPNKRKVYLHDEGALLSSLRESLEEIYSSNKCYYTINNIENGTQLNNSQLMLSRDTKEKQSYRTGGKTLENASTNMNLDYEDGDTSLSRENVFDAVSCHPKSIKECANDCTEIQTFDTSASKLSSFVNLSDLKYQNANSKHRSDNFRALLKQQEKNSARDSTQNIAGASSKLVQSRLAEYITHNKRQREEEALLSEEPVMKKWMFSAGEKSNDLIKENIKVAKVGILSERIALSVCSANSRASKSTSQPMLGAKDKTIKVSADGCETENIMCERSPLPYSSNKMNITEGKTDSVSVEKHHRSSEIKSQLGSLDNEVGSLDNEVGTDQYVGLKMEDSENPIRDHHPVNVTTLKNTESNMIGISDPMEPAKHVAAVRENEPDLQIETGSGMEQDSAKVTVQFNISRCRMLRKRGILGCSQSKHNMKMKSGCPKKSFSAASLENTSHFENDIVKEASFVAATNELERSFNKADFRKMQVIGQFNFGFIIAKINDDLFIIDQHASDEKYNFERLCQTTILNSQPLLRPLQMELSVAEELILSQHIYIFRRNGFDFLEDHNALSGRRFRLSAIPYSKNITFGVDDVKELIALLIDRPPTGTSNLFRSVEGSDVPDSVYKNAISGTVSAVCPSRVKAMLASRACRSSIMIGDALTKKTMEMILMRLSTLKSPWNCPHGRPTMRHLIDLESVNKVFSSK